MMRTKDESALLTDLYQLTMAYGYWRSGKADQEAVFYMFFRRPPFKGGFTVCSGLEDVVHWISRFRFTDEDITYLGEVTGSDGRALFPLNFLEHLRALQLHLDVDAVPEGTVMFPHEPLIRVRGPLLHAQLVETAILNFINFHSLIATKAARICMAAHPDPVVDFGLRRAQGPDGGISASRAAYVGGCAGTSNVLAGKLMGIPVKGTHAHSWVTAFEDEVAAFEAYAHALPNNSILLVDTYDTLEGVRHAAEVGQRLKAKGFQFGGVRLDSGDLAYLSVAARKILDAAGFPEAVIVGSNDLDEHLITSLKLQGAAINLWGVGTRLVTAYDDPALGGVYKLSAIRELSRQWRPTIKLSEQMVKVTTPGILQVRRFRKDDEFIGDAIFDEESGCPENVEIVDPADPTRRKRFPATNDHEDLLRPVMREGRVVWEPPPLEKIRERVRQQLALLHPGIKRFLNPHQYPAGLEYGLHDLKTRLVSEMRSVHGAQPPAV